MQINKLMGSVSSVALVVAGGQQAAAEGQSLLSGYTLNVQGGVGGMGSAWNDKLEGSGGDKFGDVDEYVTTYTGALTLTRQTAPNRDMAFGLSFGTSQEDVISFSGGGSGSGGVIDPEFPILIGPVFQSAIGSEGLTFAALDFEIGTTVPMGAADMRWFYGARALASRSTIGQQFEVEDKFGSAGTGEAELRSEYVGVGPRVGVGFSTNPVPGTQLGNFGFSGEIGAALLLGSRTDTETERFTSGGFESSLSSSTSERKNVTSLDAQIGVDYYLSDNAVISVGYQLQQLWNVDFVSDEENSSDFAGPRLIQGAFIGFTTQF